MNWDNKITVNSHLNRQLNSLAAKWKLFEDGDFIELPITNNCSGIQSSPHAVPGKCTTTPALKLKERKSTVTNSKDNSKDNYSEIIKQLVKQIFYSEEPGKEKVIVIFKDGSKIIKSPQEGDLFDKNIGVALCIMEKLFGTKSQFHKYIKRTAKVCPSKKEKNINNS